VRTDVTAICAAQGGLITHGQLARSHGADTARVGLAELAELSELDEVIPDVWVHQATGRLPLGDLELEAQARWLALAPSLLLRERTEHSTSDDPVAVIGGGAAWVRWGFGPTVWRPEIAVPTAQLRIGTDEIVQVVTEEIDRLDVVWQNQYPYLSPEATLARAYGADPDLDNIATALTDAMWRLHPIRPELLAYHLNEVIERASPACDAKAIYRQLIALSGGWPSQPGRPLRETWWPRAEHLRRMQRRCPSWLTEGVLIDR
jgi:hypothetical protein